MHGQSQRKTNNHSARGKVSMLSNVYSFSLSYFLTACRKNVASFLPLAARKPKLVLPYRSSALTSWRRSFS